MNVRVTRHAVARYIERVKPQLGEEQAWSELEALVALASSCPRPRWVEGPAFRDDAYINLGPGVVGALKGGSLLATVLVEPVRTNGRRTRRRKRRNELHRWKERHSSRLPHARIEDEAA